MASTAKSDTGQLGGGATRLEVIGGSQSEALLPTWDRHYWLQTRPCAPVFLTSKSLHHRTHCAVGGWGGGGLPPPPPLISSHVGVTYRGLYHQVLHRTEHTCSVLSLLILMQKEKFSGVRFLNVLETAFSPIRTEHRGVLPSHFCECGKNVFSLCRWHAINRCVRLPVSFPRYDERAVRHAWHEN